MRRVNSLPAAFRLAIISIATFAYSARAIAANACDNPLYLTFDTGHMDIAPLVADVLQRQNVKVTFFAANERTNSGAARRSELIAMFLPKTSAVAMSIADAG